jgi:peptidoglycan-N-acetylglucosamine deacetylase
MVVVLLWMGFILLLIYWIIPEILTYVLGCSVFRKSIRCRGVALTFDDGPDPVYTPRLLDLLKEFQLKATFFVLSSKAEQYPDLILRMHDEGHLIGIHNYVHRANWVMTPWAARRQLNHSAAILQNITGVRPVYFRPPWGLLNFFDLFLPKEFQIVLWSIMVGDWRRRGGSEKIKNRLLRKIKEGAVILLHDNGETWGANPDAPNFTIKALRELLQEGLLQNHTWLRIDELIQKERTQSHVSLRKQCLVHLWLLWEKILLTLLQIKPVDEKRPFLKVRTRSFKGKTIFLPQGEEIHKGDLVVELHLNNEWLYKMGIHSVSFVQFAIQLIREAEQLLPEVAKFIHHHPNEGQIKGIYGITIVHRGTKQLGFSVIDLPKGWFSLFTKIYLRLLLRIVHPEGKQRLKTKADLLVPKVVAVSKREFLQRYSHENIRSIELSQTEQC